ncbi:hypothetical protein PV08_03265 [Exophiala spinifera]|uniref:Zinc finger PHD-type domain-containing protein n=1 Tax=Exophiala spinifera TaxID=91928 RepID=A0A0D1YUQ0_9EURO|nr:uncharacterized protein PV08_03265 [Exophiala spinifera]KIW18976.1 hypothetical protein PV08_03265 [Exophiala spinifera]
MSLLPPPGVYRRGRYSDSVYLCGGSSAKSFSGRLLEEHRISEAHIRNFVWWSNSSLFHKLNKLPLASSHLPGGYETESQLALPEEKEEYGTLDYNPLSSSAEEAMSRDRVVHEVEPTVEMKKDPSRPDFNLPSKLDTPDGRSTDGRSADILHKQNDSDRVCHRCSTACADLTYIIQHENNLASMTDDVGNDMQKVPPNTGCLCLDCIQLMMERKPACENKQEISPYNMDGACEREKILEAAEKLHPPLTEKEIFFNYLPEAPTLEPGEGSNSVKGVRLRRQKQYEIVRIQQQLEEMDHAHIVQSLYREDSEADDSQSEDGKPDLRLVPPVPYEPYRHRYRKQGLEWKNRLDHLREQETEPQTEEETGQSSECDGESDPESGANKLIPSEEIRPTCWCLQTLYHEKMIRCSSVACPYGFIHLRCSDLEELPKPIEEYVCPRCTKCAFEGAGSTLEEGSISRSSTVGSIVGTPRGYEASISTNEQSSDDEGLDQDDAENDDHVPQVSGWVAVNM